MKHVPCNLRCIGHRDPCTTHHGVQAGRWTRLHGHVVNRELCGGPFEPFDNEVGFLCSDDSNCMYCGCGKKGGEQA